MNTMRQWINLINEIAMPPKPSDPPDTPISDAELKDRLFKAAKYGWSKPQKGTEIRKKLDVYMDDPTFRSRIEAVRPTWINSEGDELVGSQHWSKTIGSIE